MTLNVSFDFLYFLIPYVYRRDSTFSILRQRCRDSHAFLAGTKHLTNSMSLSLPIILWQYLVRPLRGAVKNYLADFFR